MAEKRMISKSISVSEKVNIGLTNNFSRLLYSWIIPHTDDFGRMPGSPAKIKALVIPMLNETMKDVTAALQEMHEAGLIIWYEIEGHKYIQIRNFEEHQSGLHKRTSSKFPEPPNDSRKFPEIPLEENRTEEKRTEQEEKRIGREGHSTFNHPIKDRLYELGKQCELKGLNIASADDIFFFIDKMAIEVIETAIKKSYEKHLNYAVKMLTDWMNEGKLTMESFESKRTQNRFSKQKPYIPIVRPTKDEDPMTDEEIEEIKKMAEKLKEEPA